MSKIFEAKFNSKKTQHPEGEKSIIVFVSDKMKKDAIVKAVEELKFWDPANHELYKHPVMSESTEEALNTYLADKEIAGQMDVESAAEGEFSNEGGLCEEDGQAESGMQLVKQVIATHPDYFSVCDPDDVSYFLNTTETIVEGVKKQYGIDVDYKKLAAHIETMDSLMVLHAPARVFEILKNCAVDIAVAPTAPPVTTSESEHNYTGFEKNAYEIVAAYGDVYYSPEQIAEMGEKLGHVYNEYVNEWTDYDADKTLEAVIGTEFDDQSTAGRYLLNIRMLRAAFRECAVKIEDTPQPEPEKEPEQPAEKFYYLEAVKGFIAWVGVAETAISGAGDRFEFSCGLSVHGVHSQHESEHTYTREGSAATNAWGHVVDLALQHKKLFPNHTKECDKVILAIGTLGENGMPDRASTLVSFSDIEQRIAADAEEHASKEHPEPESKFFTENTPKDEKPLISPERKKVLDELFNKPASNEVEKPEMAAVAEESAQKTPEPVQQSPGSVQEITKKVNPAPATNESADDLMASLGFAAEAPQVTTEDLTQEEEGKTEKAIIAANEMLATLEPGLVEIVDDMPNAVYHGTNGVSSTKVKDACVSLMYYNGKYNTGEIKQPNGNHFCIGNLAHTLILEPELVGEEYEKAPAMPQPTKPQREKYDAWVKLGRPSQEENKKAYPTPIMLERCEFWDEFNSKHSEKIIIGEDDWTLAENMAAAVRVHPDASRILDHPARKSERSYFKVDEETGQLIKVRPDIEVGQIVGDLKTIALRGNPDEEWLLNELRREIKRRKYHLSAAMYLDVTEKSQFVWVFVNKEPGYHWVAIVRASREILQEGYELYRNKLTAIAEAYQTEVWPGPVSIGKALNQESGRMEYPEI